MIYFLEATGTGLIKIGCAVDVQKRIALLQTGCPHRLALWIEEEGGLKKERHLHKKFQEDRVRGEWFAISTNINAYVEDVIRRQAVSEHEQLKANTPTILGTTSGPRWARDCCFLDCVCPICGIVLHHSYCPGGDDWNTPQHRVSHCRCHPNGYFIAPYPVGEANHEFDPTISLHPKAVRKSRNINS